MDFTAGYLFAAGFVSTVGFGFFLYGKKQLRLPQLFTGLALMIFPYFVSSPGWILGLGASICAGLWVAVRAGL